MSPVQEDLTVLEGLLGYSFRKRAILVEALTHKSFHHENPQRSPSYNERLEFLGDSVLGLVIAAYVFSLKETYPESRMSKIKSSVVRGSLLADVAQEILLGRFLLLGKGEEETGGRKKRSILADALEAVFGAIYLDSGYETVRAVILKLFEERIRDLISTGGSADFKTELQEESQMLFGMLPEYRVVSQEGEEHRKTFTVDVFIGDRKYGTGTGKSKKEAQARAAQRAAETLAMERRNIRDDP